MSNETMQRAMDDFILQRINDRGCDEPEALQQAWDVLTHCGKKLKNVLLPEQVPAFQSCENALSLIDGETRNYCYRAGFSDAVVFLWSWREAEWN